jgi:peptidoglycan/LPS O-acetylase OafA/YrhL
LQPTRTLVTLLSALSEVLTTSTQSTQRKQSFVQISKVCAQLPLHRYSWRTPASRGTEGGFIGVDVFLVISGYLITGLLLGDLATFKRVRFWNFYARRAMRILPVATLVIITTALASVAILGIVQARSVMLDSAWAAFFAANIHFAAAGTDYFNTAAASPLQHYWSLAVEEQFYLIWPAVLGFCAAVFRTFRANGNPYIPIAVILTILGTGSFIFSVTQSASNPTNAYFSTLDRSWELAVGAVLALASPHLDHFPNRLRMIVSWVGIAAIVAALFLFNALTVFPGWKALLPVLGSAAVVAGGAGAPSGGAHHLLSLRPLRFFGKISYSLYLWHYPILILGAAYFGNGDSMAVRVLLIVCAVIVSTFSYYCLENPLRHAKVLLCQTWRALSLWPIALVSVVSISVLAVPSAPFASAAGPATEISAPVAVALAVHAARSGASIPLSTSPNLLTAHADHVDLGDCSAFRKATSRICNFGDKNGTRTIVVFGNSHSAMWVPAIAVAAKDQHWKFYPVVKEACSYEKYSVAVSSFSPKNSCALWFDWALVQIKRLRPNVIVLGSYTFTPHWMIGETKTINELKNITPRFILLSDSPWIPEPDTCLLMPGATQGTCLTTEWKSRIVAQTATASIAQSTGVQYLDTTNWFCDEAFCPSIIKPYPVLRRRAPHTRIFGISWGRHGDCAEFERAQDSQNSSDTFIICYSHDHVNDFNYDDDRPNDDINPRLWLEKVP